MTGAPSECVPFLDDLDVEMLRLSLTYRRAPACWPVANAAEHIFLRIAGQRRTLAQWRAYGLVTPEGVPDTRKARVRLEEAVSMNDGRFVVLRYAYHFDSGEQAVVSVGVTPRKKREKRT